MNQRNQCERILVSISETQDIAGIGRTKVYELIGEDAIQSVKIGSRRLIVLASLRGWIASLRAKA